MRRTRWVLFMLAGGCYDPIYGEVLGDTAAAETGGSADPALPADVADVFTRSCSGSTCHVGGTVSPRIDDHASLVNEPSSVDGLDYIEPGDLEASYLYAKVTGAQGAVGGGGSDMPLSADPLSDADLLTLSTWITEGAPAAQ